MDGYDPPLQLGHLSGGKPIVKPIHRESVFCLYEYTIGLIL
jgi:hypothetical protein